ncbi:MAG: amino acid adenylation domain-containing protein, partial [bacterium]|nr:amino acid adenylation domain-containing protein [bacterium]
VEDPERRLSELPWWTEAARHQLLVEWNGTPGEADARSIHQLFETQAKHRPDAVALVFDPPAYRHSDLPGEQITYRELEARANRLAHYLRRLGVEPETPVGLFVERSVEMVVAILGILKAGGAYVPLDPDYPPDRLRFMLEQSQAGSASTVLLTQQRLLGRLPAQDQPVVCLDRDQPAIAGESELPPRASTGAESLLYVMYTSGSTGRPKGVSVIHRGVARLVRQADYARLVAEDTFLQMAPICFDASTFEIWGALVNGARLVIGAPGAVSMDELGAALCRHRVTTLWLTAGLFHLMVDHRIEHLRGLRQLLAGGDVLSVPHVRRVLRELPDCRLVNGYGPTENTTFTTCHRVMDVAELQTSVPIGRPINETQLRVLDRRLRPVPIGIPGELYAGGAGLARGYCNRAALSAERFVPDPLSGDPCGGEPDRRSAGTRLYRTGDLVRRRHDGAIEFLGRIDRQVKVRGFRIELGEVEAVVARHPQVQEAVVVVGTPDGGTGLPGDRRLVAYVVREQGEQLDAEALRADLGNSLPDYMVPAALVWLERLPLTPNGKVDRRALPAPVWGRDEKTALVAPRTPEEELLADIWAELLGVGEVGVDDDFFELGGHSLLATQVISRVREAFRVELSLLRVFEAPTVAGLALSIREIREKEQGIDSAPIRPMPRDGDPPLSFAQQRLWFLNQLESGTPIYNMPSAVRLSGRVDASLLESILHRIVRRHEALRTTFAAAGGRPVQVIAEDLRLPLPVVDLGGLEETGRETETRRLAAEDARRPFDLEAGPLIRVTLLRLAQEDHVVLAGMHHIVSDGWSTAVFTRELGVLYDALSQGRAVSGLAELPVQYADFACWQRQWLKGEVLERELAYWKRQLGTAPQRTELPCDRPRPAVQSFRGSSRPAVLPRDLSTALAALARRQGVTLFMTLLAGFQTLLARHTGQDDGSVGSPIAGRNRKEIEGLIGFFVNTLVLRSDLRRDPSFCELLTQVRQVALDAYAHQNLPFERLVEE